MSNRRSFLKAAGLGLAAVSVPAIASASSPYTKKKKNSPELKLGVASYSLRKFSREEALDMTLRCGVNRITFKSMHLPLDSDAETIKNALALCKEKGVTLYGGGVIALKSKAEADQAFEYAKMAGFDMIIGDPSYEMLAYVEQKVKEYDIKLAIHNHGPGEHTLYPSALDAFEKIKHMDARMGLCVDIGHTVRINRDPIDDIKTCFDRVFDIHVKDVTENKAEGTTCIVGRGVIDIVGFLNAMADMSYAGTLALEYEADENDPLPGMMASIGYLKGVLATM